MLFALTAPGTHVALADLSEFEICREAAGEVMKRILACSRVLDDLGQSSDIRRQAARERARGYYLKGDYDQAIADYTVALQLGPAVAADYIDRGLAYEEKGDYDRAIVNYTEAIRIAPDDAGAYQSRGRVHAARREYELAIADYTQAIRARPGSGFTHYLRAHAYQELSRSDNAIADYRRALEAPNPYEEAMVKAALRKLGATP
jgi:tetratricopeptide (TPR) repeat protein